VAHDDNGRQPRRRSILEGVRLTTLTCLKIRYAELHERNIPACWVHLSDGFD
jgi:hypothetical protein